MDNVLEGVVKLLFGAVVLVFISTVLLLILLVGEYVVLYKGCVEVAVVTDKYESLTFGNVKRRGDKYTYEDLRDVRFQINLNFVEGDAITSQTKGVWERVEIDNLYLVLYDKGVITGSKSSIEIVSMDAELNKAYSSNIEALRKKYPKKDIAQTKKENTDDDTAGKKQE